MFLRNHGVYIDHDKNKSASQAGSAHPLLRFTQDTLQARNLTTMIQRSVPNVEPPTPHETPQAYLTRLEHMDEAYHVILDIGSKYVNVGNVLNNLFLQAVDLPHVLREFKNPEHKVCKNGTVHDEVRDFLHQAWLRAEDIRGKMVLDVARGQIHQAEPGIIIR